MKQYITIEQLNELSYDAKRALRKWWKPKLGDWYVCEHPAWSKTPALATYKHHAWKSKRGYPLLSIGQMIEFLNEHPEKFDLSKRGQWGDGYFDFNWDGELCDMLWEQVKEVLES